MPFEERREAFRRSFHFTGEPFAVLRGLGAPRQSPGAHYGILTKRNTKMNNQ